MKADLKGSVLSNVNVSKHDRTLFDMFSLLINRTGGALKKEIGLILEKEQPRV